MPYREERHAGREFVQFIVFVEVSTELVCGLKMSLIIQVRLVQQATTNRAGIGMRVDGLATPRTCPVGGSKRNTTGGYRK